MQSVVLSEHGDKGMTVINRVEEEEEGTKTVALTSYEGMSNLIWEWESYGNI